MVFLPSDANEQLLTERQLEVARRVAYLYSNREIAEFLVISTKTVEAHVRGILDKLGLHRRGELAAWLLARGFIGIDSFKLMEGKDAASITLSMAEQARSVLERLTSSLNLTTEQIGQMLGVSAEQVVGWRRGEATIPLPALIMLLDTIPALDSLEAAFLPDRLPEVIRRPSRLFGGESALDWIVRGRIRDVADRYDRLLMYQT